MSHLTLEQRYTIEVLKAKKYKQNAIAEVIGKGKSAISCELMRNTDKRNRFYKSDLVERNIVFVNQRSIGNPQINY